MSTGMELVDAIRAERAKPPSGISTLELDRTHRWLTEVEPGRVVMIWKVEDRYANLEGAVICSWLVALADQALFFASNTICGEGESTRMRDLQFRHLRNIMAGSVTIEAVIDDRVDDDMIGRCSFTTDDELAAVVDVRIEVRR